MINPDSPENLKTLKITENPEKPAGGNLSSTGGCAQIFGFSGCFKVFRSMAAVVVYTQPGKS